MLGIIMAGGQGSRLMPLTATRPKPMVEVLGRPVIDFVKDAMVDAGIREIVVTTGYRGEQLQAHVDRWSTTFANGEHLSARINQEATPMGTAGSVGLLREHITTTCVVGSGDSVASFDIASLLAAHRKHGAKVTMALWEVDNPSEFGIVGLSNHADGAVDGDLREGFIRRFLEKPSPDEAFSNVINAGLYILEPEVFEHVPMGEKFDFSKQLFPKLLEMGWPMYAQTIDGVWFDVGQPFELIKAQSTLMQRYDDLPFSYPAMFTSVGDVLHANNAEVRGSVKRSVLGSTTVISTGATVVDSLLMDGCTVETGATVSGSVVGQDVIIPNNTLLDGCVVGDGATLVAGRAYVNEKIANQMGV
ncbi:MAG: sugar phosphate nucleotidyltransferase [Poseidonia sp.]